MAHAQKPDFVFPRNGRVHLNRRGGCQFSRLLAAEVCASAWVMLDRPRSEVAWEYWLPTLFASFRFTSPPVRHRVPPGSERALRHTAQAGVKMHKKKLFLKTSRKRQLERLRNRWKATNKIIPKEFSYIGMWCTNVSEEPPSSFSILNMEAACSSHQPTTVS